MAGLAGNSANVMIRGITWLVGCDGVGRPNFWFGIKVSCSAELNRIPPHKRTTLTQAMVGSDHHNAIFNTNPAL